MLAWGIPQIQESEAYAIYTSAQNNFLNFDLIWNTGIGFGLLSSDSSFFYNNVSVLIVSIVVLLFFIALIADAQVLGISAYL